jgi:DNA-binding transcriptional MerR regulator
MEEAEQQLKALKGLHLSMSDFIEELARMIPLFVGKQIRYKVKDLPTRRTIQFYLQKGLIDKPGRLGRNTAFSYRHMLQALTVKKLQAEYLPLRKIREITHASSDHELEATLTTERQTAAQAYRSPVLDTSWSYCRRVRIDEHLELYVDERFDLISPSVDLDVINARIINALSILSLPGPAWSSYDSKALSVRTEEEPSLSFLPAPPVQCLASAVIALITEGGLVPRGNPDGLESSRATRFFKYSLDGLPDLRANAFESIDRGWDTNHVNADPNRLVPLDVMRELEKKKLIGRTHDYLYTTTGVATTVESARKIGKEIAEDLKLNQISAAILTAT